MPMTADKLEEYLARIGLDSAPAADEAGLAELHAAHVFNIPFENLDIQLGRGISLDAHDVFDKLVTRRRGGYCFEQNALFDRVLSELGFSARTLAARVLFQSNDVSGRTHQLSLVTIDGRDWIADVGFGGAGLRRPIPFELDRVEEQYGEQYRLVEHALGVMLQGLSPKGWRDLYAFTLDRVYPKDIEVANHYTSSHPDARFVTERFVTQPNLQGRKTLLGMEFSTFTGAERVTRAVNPGQDYMDLLGDEFGIVLDAKFDDFKVLPAG